MPKKYNNKKGFTLIEILVAVIIVGILASILVPTYQKYILKSRAAEALNLLEMVKTRQHIELAKSPTKTYVPNAASLAPLTAGATEAAQGVDLIVNSDYTVTLNSSSQCAIVIYKQGTADEFTFAASYERPGVACVGTVCNSFTSVTTNDIDSVCVLETHQQVAPPPDQGCDKTCPDFAPLNADICGCVCTNTGNLMNDLPPYCPEPSCQDDFTGCPGDKILTPIPTNLCNCACPPTKPIEGANDTCLDCNDACPTNMSFIWSPTRRRCESVCPTGTILDSSSSPSNPQCISCAQATGGASPLWVANSTITPSENTGLCVVSNGGHCEPCPSDRPIWDGSMCISCNELHAYAASKTSSVTSGGSSTGYTYTEVVHIIKDQATSAAPKSGGTKAGGDDKITGGLGDDKLKDGDDKQNNYIVVEKNAATAGVKSTSGTSTVYDNLIATYGSGQYWYNGMCRHCYEIPEFSDRPVYDEATDTCVSCIEKYPAKVKCSAANTSSNNGGNSSYYGGGHEFGGLQYSTSLPTRFNDYMTDFRANIDKYALDSGALLAVQWGVGWIDEFGHEMTLEDVTHMLENCQGCKCGMSGTCSSCYGHQTYNTYTNEIPPCDANHAGDHATASCSVCNHTMQPNPMVENDCFGGDIVETSGSCECRFESGEYRWLCSPVGCDFGGYINATGLGDCVGQGCQVLPVGSGGFQSYYISGNYVCNIREMTIPGNSSEPPSTFDTTPQGSCEDTWYGATEYVPAKPIWNSTTHQCEACPSPTLNACSSTNGQQGQFSLSNVYYWNGGNTCAHIGGLTVSSVEGYQMPHCFSSGDGTLYKYIYCGGQGGGNSMVINGCNGQFYFKDNATKQHFLSKYQNGYPTNMLHVKGESGIDTSVINFLDALTSPQTINGVTMFEPRSKKFYAITKLGLAPVDSFFQYVVVE